MDELTEMVRQIPRIREDVCSCCDAFDGTVLESAVYRYIVAADDVMVCGDTIPLTTLREYDAAAWDLFGRVFA